MRGFFFSFFRFCPCSTTSLHPLSFCSSLDSFTITAFFLFPLLSSLPINFVLLSTMNNYPSHTFSSIYSYPVVRQYSLPPNYYSYKEYPSSSRLLSPMPYISLPRERYSSSLKYYNDDDAYFSEYHHSSRHHRPSDHWQYTNNQNLNRARNISR